MRNTLESLETIIKKSSVNTDILSNQSLSALHTEVEKIKQFWLEKAVSLKTGTPADQPDAMQAQYALSNIQNMIANHIENKFPQTHHVSSETMPAGYQEIIAALEELETILEKFFFSYIDLSNRVPLLIFDNLTRTINTQIKPLKTILTTKKADTVLVNAILQPLEAIATHNSGEKITTGRLLVVREIIEHLTEMLNPNNITPDPTMQLLNIAVYCNLNTYSITTAATAILKARHDKTEFPLEKLYLITSHINHFTELKAKDVLQYDNTSRPLKTILLEWLASEYSIQKTEVAEWEAIHSTPSNTKVETKLSVGELGVFIKLFFQEGILLNKNKKQLIRLFAKSFHPINKKNDQYISEFKLWNATYKTNYTTLINVRRWLKSLLNNLDEMIKTQYFSDNPKR